MIRATKPTIKILIVDDEAVLRRAVRTLLENSGQDFRFGEAETAHSAWEQLHSQPYDLVLLDWLLQGPHDGLSLLARIRQDFGLARLPVIMLTARDTVDHRIKGLDRGADDYIVKPFSGSELLSRINAVIRRVQDQWISAKLRNGPLELDPESNHVTADGREFSLRPMEFRLLYRLMMQPGRVLSRRELCQVGRDADKLLEGRALDVQMSRLREALRSRGRQGKRLDLSDRIETIRGVGYRFIPFSQARQTL